MKSNTVREHLKHFNPDEVIKAAKYFKRKKNQIPKNKEHSTQYHNYLVRARRRNMEFDIEPQLFEDITNRSCVYCGISPAKTIDRIDSKVGYKIDNIQPLCYKCNTMKYTYTETEFFDHLRKVVSHLHL